MAKDKIEQEMKVKPLNLVAGFCWTMFQGAKYYGWDEPSKSEFTKERYENELKRKIKQKKVDSKNYVKRLRLEFEKSK